MYDKRLYKSRPTIGEDFFVRQWKMWICEIDSIFIWFLSTIKLCWFCTIHVCRHVYCLQIMVVIHWWWLLFRVVNGLHRSVRACKESKIWLMPFQCWTLQSSINSSYMSWMCWTHTKSLWPIGSCYKIIIHILWSYSTKNYESNGPNVTYYNPSWRNYLEIVVSN